MNSSSTKIFANSVFLLKYCKSHVYSVHLFTIQHAAKISQWFVKEKKEVEVTGTCRNDCYDHAV